MSGGIYGIYDPICHPIHTVTLRLDREVTAGSRRMIVLAADGRPRAGLGGNAAEQAKVFLDGFDAAEQVIDLLGEPGEVPGRLFELVELVTNRAHFLAQIAELCTDGVKAVMHPVEFVQHDPAKVLDVSFFHVETS